MKIFVRLLVACLALASLSLAPVRTPQRDLTFQERLDAQRAIERVYYSHQIGATQDFDNAVPAAVLAKKVRDYLKQSVALEKFWNTPVTAEMLHQELERITKATRYPDRLREVFTALRNDTFLIEECFVRPALVDRLAKTYLAGDGSLQLEARQTWEEFRAEREKSLDESSVRAVSFGGPIPGTVLNQNLEFSCPTGDAWNDSSLNAAPDPVANHTAVWTGNLMIVWGGSVIDYGGWRYNPLIDSWTRVSALNAPSSRSGHSAVWTGSEMIVWGGGAPATNTGGRYDPVLDNWSTTSLAGAPSSRSRHTAVWTGSEMIVWGGTTGSVVTNTGGRYDPSADTWIPTRSDATTPQARIAHSAVWTGSEMIVWGGNIRSPANPFLFQSLQDGSRYNPATDSWTATLPVNSNPRAEHTAVWTGSRMVVWGGIQYSVNFNGQQTQTRLNSGNLYNPSTNSWTPTDTVTAPMARGRHTAVWTGSRMIVWGGNHGFASGAGSRYDPIGNTWSPVTTTGDPAAADNSWEGHSAVWTGDRMIVWGGSGRVVHNNGGRYDPVSDSWLPTASGPDVHRQSHTVVWTGSLMIVWGGHGSGAVNPVSTGARYDPLLDSWTPTSTSGAPDPRAEHTAEWTGSRMIIWGGLNSSPTPFSTGGRYNPVNDSWQPTSLVNAPSPRFLFSSVWTGTRMLVWGGQDPSSGASLDSGGSYNPSSDQWQPISSSGAPSPRIFPGSVWSGSEMLTWGGEDGFGNTLQTGARYDPVTDHWQNMSAVNAPSGRTRFTAVWTGNRMIVWGGDVSSAPANTGGLYDPASNQWTPTRSDATTPGARTVHTAVWTGTLMIVWGGVDSVGLTRNDGGLYDPAGDSWSPTALENAPSQRFVHTAVWTGDRMLVWGGVGGGGPLNSGGQYVPASGPLPDGDGDGYPCSTDCDDTDPAVHPGAAEACNGIDDNCDGAIDETGDALCTDTDPCTVDVCGGASGCSHAAAPEGSACSDDNDCTLSDTCQAGACLGTVVPDDTPCSDGQACTEGETCQAGTCSGGAPSDLPTLSAALSPTTLTPANHKLIDIVATVLAQDACGAPLGATLVSIVSSEPDDAPGPTDGHTTGDIQGAAFGTADFAFQLRAERDSKGPGRIYTVTYSTQDSAGQTQTASRGVRVPVKKNSPVPPSGSKKRERN